MKLPLLIILVIILYLTFSYWYFYAFIGFKHLSNPNTQSSYSLTNSKNKGSFKLVTLGDSLTAGVGAGSFQESFPYLLSQSLSTMHSKVELTNLGMPGATINDILTTELPQALKKKPDLVIILVGINDIHNFKTVTSFKQDYLNLVDSLSGDRVVLVNIPYLGAKFLLLPPYNILTDLRIRQFNSAILDLSREKHLTYIDLYSNIKTRFERDPSNYASDFFHPSASGYKIFATIINANWNQ